MYMNYLFIGVPWWFPFSRCSPGHWKVRHCCKCSDQTISAKGDVLHQLHHSTVLGLGPLEPQPPQTRVWFVTASLQADVMFSSSYRDRRGEGTHAGAVSEAVGLPHCLTACNKGVYSLEGCGPPSEVFDGWVLACLKNSTVFIPCCWGGLKKIRAFPCTDLLTFFQCQHKGLKLMIGITW